MSEAAKISDLTLERYLLGELPQAEISRLDELIAMDPALKARLDALKQSDAEILSEYKPADMSREILRRAESVKRQEAIQAEMSSHKKARPFMIMSAVASVLTVFLVVMLVLPDGPVTSNIDHKTTDGPIRKKDGQDYLKIFRKTADSIEQLKNLSTAGENDTIQIRYVNRSMNKYGMIYSVDGNGIVTLHFPASAGESTALMPGKVTSLEHGYRLDDAPSFEKFYFITGPAELSVNNLLKLVKDNPGINIAETELGQILKVTNFTLNKE